MSLDVALKHRFGGFALDAAFSADTGVTALFGPSGAGKTSIVHMLAGLARPDSGRIVIGGRTVLDTAKNIFVPPEQRRAGLVFQDARLFPHMSVEKNLLFGWRRAPVRVPLGEIGRMVAMLGLEKFLKRHPRNLSGGEKSRVALGRALLSSPDYLLLDEPLAALDAARRDEILPYLERLRDIARIPLIYVSHARDEVARLADRVVMLDDGKVAGQGSAAEMLTGFSDNGSLLGAVLDGRVTGKTQDGLSEVSFDGGVLWIAADSAVGSVLRLRIAADEILIAREEPRGLSANNILAVTVASVHFQDRWADVDMHAGTARLVARITAASARRLELAPGLCAYAVIKSVRVGSPKAP